MYNILINHYTGKQLKRKTNSTKKNKLIHQRNFIKQYSNVNIQYRVQYIVCSKN